VDPPGDAGDFFLPTTWSLPRRLLYALDRRFPPFLFPRPSQFPSLGSCSGAGRQPRATTAPYSRAASAPPNGTGYDNSNDIITKSRGSLGARNRPGKTEEIAFMAASFPGIAGGKSPGVGNIPDGLVSLTRPEVPPSPSGPARKSPPETGKKKKRGPGTRTIEGLPEAPKGGATVSDI